ncbi:hypothetical protein [Epilithonimonas hispanica]|uniref:Uncharacterized protein n=1 Tax=Epilithonimonas hispanica TaxID=358687 RepID=A0A3D9D038_9FLAO|nr:hypothetical protein [Epilithonimonas hispanica]REC71386.1 hypothetical protein DRF58_06100 [Epilithonimonas hispanica]
MWHIVNWKRLAIILTPTFLRGPLMKAWLELIVSGIDDIHYRWLQFRTDNLYKLNHNSQICYLRKALNDRFDSSLRRIVIASGNTYTRQYIYTDAEQKPKWLGTIYLHGDEDYSDTGVDFIVKVPQDLQFSIYEMTALIDYYKLASKRYKIIRF